MYPLEPNEEQLRQLLHVVSERLISHQIGVAGRPASGPAHPDLGALLGRGFEEAPGELEPILDAVLGPLSDGGVNTVSPGNLSYVNGGGLFHSAIASFVTAAINRYVTYWGAAPGLAELEQRVIDWMARLVGFPTSAGGVLLTGGSMANLTAIVTARTRLLGEAFLDGTVYVSDQCHHSVLKSALVAGIPRKNVRTVGSDSKQAIDLDALEEAIARDVRAGHRPFFVVGNAGTTSSGAVDDLAQLGRLSREAGCWFHVDAAYGGFFLLTERGRAALDGIDSADSVALDPHKSLFLPYGSGGLVVRDVSHLRAAHEVHSDYIAAIVEEGAHADHHNFADLSVEMSRELRGLKIWLPLKLLGTAAFRDALDEKLDLAAYAARRLGAMSGVKLVGDPPLSIVAFHLVAPPLDGAELDALSDRVVERVNARGRVHLSTTVLGGRTALRISVLSFRGHRTQVDWCLEDLGTAIADETARLRSHDG